MSDFEIEFEWPVGKYVFQPANAEQIAEFEEAFGKEKEISEAELPFMLGQIVESGEPQNVKHRVGALEEAVQKLVEWDYTYASLSKISLSIARTLGTLKSEPTKFRHRDYPPPKDDMMDWHGLAYRLRMMLEGKAFYWTGDPFQGGKRTEVQWPHQAAQFQGKVGIYLVQGRDGKPKITFRPHDLESALILCAARMITNGVTLGTCLNCESSFLRGVGSERRGDARFCKPRCKWEYHNEERRKAKS